MSNKDESDSNQISPLLPEFRDLARQRDPLFTTVDFLGWILVLGTTWTTITISRGCVERSAFKPMPATVSPQKPSVASGATNHIRNMKQMLGDIDPEHIPEHAQDVVEHAREITAEQIESPPEWFKVMTDSIDAMSEWLRRQFVSDNEPHTEHGSSVE